MDRNKDGGSSVSFEEFSSFFSHGDNAAQDRLSGSRTQAHDHFWMNDFKFGLQPRLAGDHLPDERFLVQAPLASLDEFEVFHCVGDINFLPEYARLGEGFVKHTARRSHKRPTLPVLNVSWLFTDKHGCRTLRTFAENRLAGIFVQIAASARKRGGAQARKGAPLWHEFGGRFFLF